jgi:hypothetical protein
MLRTPRLKQPGATVTFLRLQERMIKLLALLAMYHKSHKQHE